MSRMPEKIYAWMLDNTHMDDGWSTYPGDPEMDDIHVEYVRADVHTAALAAEKEKVRELVEALNLAIVHKYTHDGRILLEKYSKEEPNNE